VQVEPPKVQVLVMPSHRVVPPQELVLETLKPEQEELPRALELVLLNHQAE